jgi:hypothetical protein
MDGNKPYPIAHGPIKDGILPVRDLQFVFVRISFFLPVCEYLQIICKNMTGLLDRGK